MYELFFEKAVHSSRISELIIEVVGDPQGATIRFAIAKGDLLQQEGSEALMPGETSLSPINLQTGERLQVYVDATEIQEEALKPFHVIYSYIFQIR